MTPDLKTPPILDLDLFSDASLRDPFVDYRRLRDAGPLVRLARPDVYAIGRFAQLQAALRSSERLCSGEGVGMSDSFNARKGMNVLQSDGELHHRLRATVMRPLMPTKLREVRDGLKGMILERVRALAGKGWFDAMQQVARFLPVEAISHLVGLPNAGRERMLDWAAATFNLIGPQQNMEDLAVVGEARAFMSSLDEGAVRNGSWAGELFAATKTGRLSQAEAMAAISAYVIPSLDTTILAKGHLLNALARNPDQWDMVRGKPELIPAAVVESVRLDSVLRWFSRVALLDYEVDGFLIPKGARVMLLYGSANRDERRYADPDDFVVMRDVRDQLAWGTGAHMCAGMHLARMEMEVMVEALVEIQARLSVGHPTVSANRGLYGFTELPFRIDLV